MSTPLEYFRKVNTVVFDVDGVFTDSHMLITEEGQLLRSMSTRDGWAVKQLIRSGMRVCVITGGNSKGVQIRLAGLGIPHIFSDIRDKLGIFRQWADEENIDADRTLFMGDDIPDLAVMKEVGIRACPADAVPEIKAIAQYISPYKGGEGCVRDLVEKVMKIQGSWPV